MKVQPRKQVNKLKKTKKTSFFSFVKPHLPLIVCSVFLALVSAVCQLLIPVFCGRAIDCMQAAASVRFDGVLRFIVYVLLTALAGAAAQQLLGMCNNRITYCMTADLRNTLSDKLHRLPLSYLDAHPSGDLLGRVIADADTVADGLLMALSQLFTGIVTIIGILIIMFYYNAFISLVVVVLTPLSLFTATVISRRTHNYFTRQAIVRGEETAMIQEVLDGQRVIASYAHSDETVKSFDEVNEKLKQASFHATFLSSLVNPTTRMMNNLVYAAVTLTSALLAVGGGLSIGQISVFLSYAAQYAKPFNEISGVVTELQNAFASIRRIFEVLDESEEPAEPKNAVTLTDISRVAFDDISFSYTPQRPLIEHLSLTALKGQRVAIVGPTGCGKTTLINLLMRFYDVSRGTLYMNDTDIRRCTRRSLRRNIGMVLQDTWLKSGTVRDNIAYGKPDATDEEIVEAAKMAHAHSFIKRLPQGYQTVISENGDSLSAGQKQLLCIARVMLCLPPLLILDEATSSIDTRTEQKIQSAFARLMQGRTSFIVAHRLSTTREADVILVMKDGNIIEQGTHEALLAQNGFYAHLYNSQFAEN